MDLQTRETTDVVDTVQTEIGEMSATGMIGEMAGDHLIDEGTTEGGGHWIEREKSDGGPPPRIGANRGTAGRLTKMLGVIQGKETKKKEHQRKQKRRRYWP